MLASEKLEEPDFKFDVPDKAAKFNMKLLKDNEFDLDRLLNEKSSVTQYGSEFKTKFRANLGESSKMARYERSIGK